MINEKSGKQNSLVNFVFKLLETLSLPYLDFTHRKMMTSEIIEPEPQNKMATITHNRKEYRLPGREDWATIQTLLPYLWPKNEADVKARVLAALLCLGISKLATVLVTVFYKEAVDLISTDVNFLLTSLIWILIKSHLMD